jgi:integrase
LNEPTHSTIARLAVTAMAGAGAAQRGRRAAVRLRTGGRITVDFERRTLHVRRSFTKANEGLPKSGKVRSVPLIEDAARVLDALSRRVEFVGDADHVFCNGVGGVLDDGPLRDRFYDALKGAELGHLRDGSNPFRFHDLRHTFGTLAVQVWPLTDVLTRTCRRR